MTKALIGRLCGHLTAAAASWILSYQNRTRDFAGGQVKGMPIFDFHITAFGAVEEACFNAGLMEHDKSNSQIQRPVFLMEPKEMPAFLGSNLIEGDVRIPAIIRATISLIEQYAIRDLVIGEGRASFSPHWRIEPPEFGPSGWFEVAPLLLPAMQCARECDYAESAGSKFRWTARTSIALNLEETNELRKTRGLAQLDPSSIENS